MDTFHALLCFAFVPFALFILGGWATRARVPRPKVLSAIQHFAAGVVFAAVSIELLPHLITPRHRLAMVIGFLIGVFLLTSLKSLSHAFEKRRGYSLGMIFAVAIDIAIDGILVGMSFIAGIKGGILIAVALSIELFFLGSSTAIELQKTPRSIFALLSMALLFPFFALFGYWIFSMLSVTLFTGMIAFGTSALLYLVTEELLIEAHKKPDSSLITSMFFLGFLLILLM